jgi:hypothetical protein
MKRFRKRLSASLQNARHSIDEGLSELAEHLSLRDSNGNVSINETNGKYFIIFNAKNLKHKQFDNKIFVYIIMKRLFELKSYYFLGHDNHNNNKTSFLLKASRRFSLSTSRIIDVSTPPGLGSFIIHNCITSTTLT